ncbi:MAG: hypothetical protein V3V09_08130 [Arenicellales bacterium]
MTAIFFQSVSSNTWLMSVYIFGISHFLLATYYSRHKITSALSNSKHYFALAPLALLGLASYTTSFSLVLYFGLHHALSEAYLVQRKVGASLNEQSMMTLQTSRFFMQLSGYILLVRNDPFFRIEQLNSLALIVFVLSSLVFVWQMWRASDNLSLHQLIKLFYSEAMLFLFLLLSLAFPITFLQVVFYHYTFWAILPFLNFSIHNKKHIKPAVIYTLLTVISIIVLIKVSPLHHPTSTRYFRFEYWFVLQSYLHITLSFATSNANPGWLIALFNRSPKAVAKV